MRREAKVIFEPSGAAGMVACGTRLLDAAAQLRVSLRQVCGGNANCTTCRVQVLAGADFLSPAEDKERNRLPESRLTQGWRLSCQALVKGPVKVRVPTVGEWIELNQQEVHGDL